MKISTKVTTEEWVEKEIELPYFYVLKDRLGDEYCAVYDEATRLKVADWRITNMRPDQSEIASGEQITEEEFKEQLYNTFATIQSIVLKNLSIEIPVTNTSDLLCDETTVQTM